MRPNAVTFDFSRIESYRRLVVMRIPKSPPLFNALLVEIMADGAAVLRRSVDPVVQTVLQRANNEGWNWEDCGYRAHLAGLSPRELWALVKLSRGVDRQDTPIRDGAGRPFTYRLPPAAHQALHTADTQLAGLIGSLSPQLSNDADHARYLFRSLSEEAIASSMYEGANTTREIAREMIRAERKPRSTGERMVWNNFRTIRVLNQRKAEPLTVDLLWDVQRMLTAGTLKKPDAAGRFRRPDEDIAVVDDESGERVFIPPSADQLPERMSRLCQFANAKPDADHFVHPVVRAILLHFWLAHDHPFVDGNGRTARALFYWSMLRQGYWLTEYLTISTVIAGHPKQYGRAYLDSETDDNDLTYFILYHLRVIGRSVHDFTDHLERKASEQRELGMLLAGPFNERQRALLTRAIGDPVTVFTYESHGNSHGVQISTAREDLLALERLGLLRGNRIGRRFEFRPAPGLRTRLQKLADG